MSINLYDSQADIARVGMPTLGSTVGVRDMSPGNQADLGTSVSMRNGTHVKSVGEQAISHVSTVAVKRVLKPFGIEQRDALATNSGLPPRGRSVHDGL